MVKYIVKCIDKLSCAEEYAEDEEFDTYEEAEEYSLICSSNFPTGAEVLGLAGRAFGNPNEVEFIVEEIET